MIESQPIRHHIFRIPEPARLCDGRTSGPDDIATREMEALREARAEATLCPRLPGGLRAPTLQPAALPPGVR